MRVLLLLRLYSGFDDALRKRHRRFSGVPAIAKLIAALAHGDKKVKILFARREGPLQWNEACDRAVELPGLSAKIEVLAGQEAWPVRYLPPPLRRRLANLRHIWPIARTILSFRPQIVYADRGHIVAAALIARCTSIPVIWRLMGVPPDLWIAINSTGYRGAFWRWLVSSPFSAVICSMDGSGGQVWMQRALHPSVTRYMLPAGRLELHGSVEYHGLADIPPRRTKVAFVGRLEGLKGALEFIDGFAKACAEAPEELHAVVVGDGSLAGDMCDLVKTRGVESSVTFCGAIDHASVMTILQQVDIFVSLNRMGNLSNVCIEAITAGVCTILPKSQPERGVDAETDEVIGADAALRFGRVGEADKLAQAILHLHRHPAERRERAERLKQVGERHFPFWGERMAMELQIIERIASGSTNQDQGNGRA